MKTLPKTFKIILYLQFLRVSSNHSFKLFFYLKFYLNSSLNHINFTSLRLFRIETPCFFSLRLRLNFLELNSHVNFSSFQHCNQYKRALLRKVVSFPFSYSRHFSTLQEPYQFLFGQVYILAYTTKDNFKAISKKHIDKHSLSMVPLLLMMFVGISSMFLLQALNAYSFVLFASFGWIRKRTPVRMSWQSFAFVLKTIEGCAYRKSGRDFLKEEIQEKIQWDSSSSSYWLSYKAIK